MSAPAALPHRRVALLGASGLVGRECLRLLLSEPGVERLVAPVRRPLEPAARLECHVVDFDRPETWADLLRVDAVVCALGTTIRRAGSRENFRKVDLELPRFAARAALQRGAGHFVVVSSLGADSNSRFFYSRVKGELEDALRALAYRSLTILRPSLLLGERTEFRLGEEIAKLFGPLARGRLAPIHASSVAAAAVRALREDRPGVRVVTSAEMRAWVRAEGGA